MSLKPEGIRQLKADLMANAIHYNQQAFARITKECGTEACLAGMCLLRKVGMEDFTQRYKQTVFDGFVSQCLDAAADQLGMEILSEEEYSSDDLPPIFSGYENWPDDLANRYEVADNLHDHTAMAQIACDALDRMDEHGFISGYYSSREDNDGYMEA